MNLKPIPFLLLFCFYTDAQEKDSAQLISEVIIDAYHKPAKLIHSTKSVSIAGSAILQQNTPDRMLEAINLLPGSRMEERSPGSYRFSIRGSTLRSPFGVRNVKVYLDDFSLTDASGNTYFNILDPEVLSEIEIYKGPEGGDFGSAIGGTALLKTKGGKEKKLSLAGGSFQNFKGGLSYAQEEGKHFYQIFSSYQTTDSYREQAALERKFLFLKDQYHYGKDNNFKAMLLLADLHYETPGGLTLEQMKTDPRQARPKTSTLPGAKEQQAGIFNKMIFAGVSNLYRLNEKFNQFLVVQGNYNDFRNPFITNYEKRFEQNFALRTHLNFEKTFTSSFYQTRVGFEGASAKSAIRNFDNNLGITGKPQNFDDIFTKSGFIFISQKAEFWEKLYVDTSGSLNLINYRWKRHFPTANDGNNNLKNDLLPSFGVNYNLSKGFSVRAKISKGNSAPTSEELRSSAQEINENLDSEYGWNKEIGVRKQWGNFLFTEVSTFDLRLKNTIVRRENENNQEYFINAGETTQKGLEFLLETKKLTVNSPYLNSIKLFFSGNFYDFKFKNYYKNGADFSGNNLTGVPKTSLQSLINLEIFRSASLSIAHFYNSSVPLNDANSVIDKPSFVGNISVIFPIKRMFFDADVKFSVQNIYNTKYSLGNDINAFGNRFYNPAATRNYLVGLQLKFK